MIQCHKRKYTLYPQIEENMQMPMAAENATV